MSVFRQTLKSEFADKEYAHSYVDGFLNASIATQIKVLREQRGWKQERLAKEAGMKQARISVLEDVDYGSWSLKTLKRLALAFDVVLTVSFETFGKRARDIEAFSRINLERVPREEELGAEENNEKGKELVSTILQELEKQSNKPQGDKPIGIPGASLVEIPVWRYYDTGIHAPMKRQVKRQEALAGISG